MHSDAFPALELFGNYSPLRLHNTTYRHDRYSTRRYIDRDAAPVARSSRNNGPIRTNKAAQPCEVIVPGI